MTRQSDLAAVVLLGIVNILLSHPSLKCTAYVPISKSRRSSSSVVTTRTRTRHPFIVELGSYFYLPRRNYGYAATTTTLETSKTEEVNEDVQTRQAYKEWCARCNNKEDVEGERYEVFATNYRNMAGMTKGRIEEIELGPYADRTWDEYVTLNTHPVNSEMGSDLNVMTVKELKEECKKCNILVSGTKATLVDRLQVALMLADMEIAGQGRENGVAAAAAAREESSQQVEKGKTEGKKTSLIAKEEKPQKAKAAKKEDKKAETSPKNNPEKAAKQKESEPSSIEMAETLTEKPERVEKKEKPNVNVESRVPESSKQKPQKVIVEEEEATTLLGALGDLAGATFNFSRRILTQLSERGEADKTIRAAAQEAARKETQRKIKEKAEQLRLKKEKEDAALQKKKQEVEAFKLKKEKEAAEAKAFREKEQKARRAIQEEDARKQRERFEAAAIAAAKEEIKKDAEKRQERFQEMATAVNKAKEKEEELRALQVKEAKRRFMTIEEKNRDAERAEKVAKAEAELEKARQKKQEEYRRLREEQEAIANERAEALAAAIARSRAGMASERAKRASAEEASES